MTIVYVKTVPVMRRKIENANGGTTAAVPGINNLYFLHMSLPSTIVPFTTITEFALNMAACELTRVHDT